MEKSPPRQMVIHTKPSSWISILSVIFLVIRNPWYLITLASFAAGNRPDAVPLLFKYALGELEQAQNQFNVPAPEANREKLLLTRKFRDAIFKGGMIGGYSRVYTPTILDKSTSS